MNKPLVAAISGVAFGATLTGAFLFNAHRAQPRHCHRQFVVQHTIVQPERPLPTASQSVDEELTPPSYCPGLVNNPVADADRQLTFAQTAYVHNDYDCASKLAEKAVTKNPVRAYRIIGATACRNQDIATVKKAFAHLDAPGRQYLVYVCARSGVSLGKRGWVITE